jgi:hypothetical protein
VEKIGEEQIAGAIATFFARSLDAPRITPATRNCHCRRQTVVGWSANRLSRVHTHSLSAAARSLATV